MFNKAKQIRHLRECVANITKSIDNLIENGTNQIKINDALHKRIERLESDARQQERKNI